MKMYDLRSDTFTKPTEAMRKAMYNAEVGDDVYGEDPTAEKLQRMAEEITGKEQSLIVSSGCMGNLIPLMLKGGRGMEVKSYREKYEGGKLVSRELLRDDKFKVQNAIKVYGTKKREENSTLLENYEPQENVA